MARPKGRKPEDDGGDESGEEPKIHNLDRHAEELALASMKNQSGYPSDRTRLADAFGKAAIQCKRGQRRDQGGTPKRVMIVH